MATTPRIKGIDNFRAHKVEFHRNGIGGRSFYAVQFSYEDEGFSPPRFHPNMVAIVPADAHLEGGDNECFVMDMSAMDEHWRGDNFAPNVRHAIEAHDKDARVAFREALKGGK